MKIGVVDLDTSHPQNWIPIERDLGHEIVGVWDGSAVHPPQYVTDFVAEHKLGRVFESLEQMAPEVDCAIVHGCDWDTHVAKARPFIDAGKSVLIDKPMAGTLGDLRQFCKWADQGARITGGSSLRFAAEAQEWLSQPIDDRGEPRTVLCGCAVDEFNYGIHAYSLISRIVGGGVQSVQHLWQADQRCIKINWANGCTGMLNIGKIDAWLPFYANIVTPKSVHQFIVDNGGIYRSLLEAVLPYLAGETDEPPIAMSELIEPELCALAARQSWLNGDRVVRLDKLTESDSGYDGAEFADGYRLARYPQE